MDYDFILKASISGGVAAFSTHLLIVPLDVLKTRMQIASSLAPLDVRRGQKTQNIKPPTLLNFSRSIWKTEGPKGFLKGVAPTNWGYFIQGSFKFGLYEHFKRLAPSLLGGEVAKKNRNAIYLSSGMVAEAIADIFLTPFEAARIRAISMKSKPMTHQLIQTIYKEGTLYRGFWPLFARQVPYTAVKFTIFERSEEWIYRWMEEVHQKKRGIDLDPLEQLGITAICGGIGGFVSAIISHPADTLLTRCNQKSYSGLCNLYREIGGVKGFWRGLTPRVAMITILASLQLLVYDACKVGFGLHTSHGLDKILH